MTQPLRYEDLEHELVSRLLAERGRLQLELCGGNAEALADLLSLAHRCQGWRQLSLWRRLGPFARGLLLTGRILLFHSKLLSLLSVVVLNSAAQTWHRRPDGTVVFQFVQRAEA